MLMVQKSFIIIKKITLEWHNLADDKKYLKIKEAHRKQLDLWLKLNQM